MIIKLTANAFLGITHKLNWCLCESTGADIEL